MSASLLPNGKQQFEDINGKPLVGGTVGMFVPNTLVQKNTWEDAGQAVLNANPIVLDSRGQAQIYGVGSYRQIVKDSLGNLIWDEPVDAFSTNALGFVPPVGAPSVTNSPSLPIVTAEMFGAVGNGIADDQPAIQAALNYLGSAAGGGAGGILQLLSKPYLVNSSLVPYSSTRIIGSGGAWGVWFSEPSAKSTQIVGGNNVDVFVPYHTGAYASLNSTIENLAIYPSGTGAGIRIRGDGGSSDQGTVSTFFVQDVMVKGGKNGIAFGNDVGNLQSSAYGCKFSRVLLDEQTGASLYANGNGTDDIVFEDLWLRSGADSAVVLNGGFIIDGWRFKHVRMEGYVAAATNYFTTGISCENLVIDDLWGFNNGAAGSFGMFLQGNGISVTGLDLEMGSTAGGMKLAGVTYSRIEGTIGVATGGALYLDKAANCLGNIIRISPISGSANGGYALHSSNLDEVYAGSDGVIDATNIYIADHTMGMVEKCALIDSTSNTVTIKLPAIGSADISRGIEMLFIVIAYVSAVSIDGNGANINGASTYSGLTAQYKRVRVKSGQGQWYIADSN